jgi:hypothetical protein
MQINHTDHTCARSLARRQVPVFFLKRSRAAAQSKPQPFLQAQVACLQLRLYQYLQVQVPLRSWLSRGRGQGALFLSRQLLGETPSNPIFPTAERETAQSNQSEHGS